MAVKILIRRMVPRDKEREMIPLFRKIRTVAMNEKGYISGETLRNMDDPEEFLVISTWNSIGDWKNWLGSKERKEIQDQMDLLLENKTEYKIFHYGFVERSAQ